MKTPGELQVIEDTYDFVKWSCGLSVRFPRILRKGLGERLEGQLFELLELLLEAKYSGPYEKVELLRRANLRLTKYRLLARLALDLKCVSGKAHQEATRRAYDIGRQIHGWGTSLKRQVAVKEQNS